MKLRRLAYLSTASQPMDEAALRNLLRAARHNNGRHRISGYLHYHQGSFIQVLEGPDRTVEETYARICRDPRHHDVRVLVDDSVSRRTFANWSMGCTCEAQLSPATLHRIQASIDKLRLQQPVLPTQVLVLFDQLMASGSLEAAA